MPFIHPMGKFIETGIMGKSKNRTPQPMTDGLKKSMSFRSVQICPDVPPWVQAIHPTSSNFIPWKSTWSRHKIPIEITIENPHRNHHHLFFLGIHLKKITIDPRSSARGDGLEEAPARAFRRQEVKGVDQGIRMLCYVWNVWHILIIIEIYWLYQAASFSKLRFDRQEVLFLTFKQLEVIHQNGAFR